MAEKRVMVGMLPEVVVLDPGEQVEWISNAGNLKIEFDPQRCPFSSNIFQAPPGVRLVSGPTRSGLAAGSFKYRLSLNDVVLAHGEVLLRAKKPSAISAITTPTSEPRNSRLSSRGLQLCVSHYNVRATIEINAASPKRRSKREGGNYAPR
jgi:hypothetical protein